jgi:5-methylcytosine-specific restriction enzyme subunit McrC
VTVVYDTVTAWSRERRELDAEHAAAIAATRVVSVEPSDDQGTWWIGADSRVGVLVGDGWQLGIRPKLAIPRLMFLLAYSMRPEGWKETVAIFGQEERLFDAVATGFAIHAERALRPGVLHHYVEVDDQVLGVRGRVRFGDQLARQKGLPLPVEVTYDEFTPNVVENRLLRTATEILLRLPLVPPPARTRLLWVRAALDEVEVLLDARSLDPVAITRLNTRYEPALRLAELIVRASSLSAEHGDVSSTSFVFDMNEVFESFLTSRLTQAFGRIDGWVQRQRRATLAPGLHMRTDITWHGREGVRAVIDAKYKSLVDTKTMPNADAYQMLAYCIALGLPRGYLIYAKDAGETARNHRVVRHGYEINVRSVDVELEPEALLGQVDALAREVADAFELPEAA